MLPIPTSLLGRVPMESSSSLIPMKWPGDGVNVNLNPTWTMTNSAGLWGMYNTMLQKFSKCEVKAHNSRIYLPLNLVWNQFWHDLSLENGHFYNFTATQILRGIEFWKNWNIKKCNFDSFKDFRLWILVIFSIEKLLKFTKIKILTLQNCQKSQFLNVSIHHNLISCKIWVAVKL